MDGKRLKEIRNKRGLSMNELADKLGSAKSSVARWESGEMGSITASILDQMSVILNVSPLYLMGIIDTPLTYSGSRTVTMDNHDEMELPLYLVDTPGAFAYRVVGESMTPYYLPGDVLFLVPDEDVVNGTDWLVQVRGGEPILRTIYVFQEGVVLLPSNTDYPPQFEKLIEGEFRFLGMVVEQKRMFK